MCLVGTSCFGKGFREANSQSYLLMKNFEMEKVLGSLLKGSQLNSNFMSLFRHNIELRYTLVFHEVYLIIAIVIIFK